ncbi:thermonuclease family protein [Campylobacter upsaliensis]|uniref:thermonuclease family protein n=1 Tax=Campylobacter upsaliensis TaxID=28080 RepID=UPI0022EAA500|nr:thermonuclease family protein [Campylobacter upsaliensis]
MNKEMVKNGYAHAYESFSKKYLAEQADAKMFKLGLWQDEKAVKPSEFRKQQIKNS